MFPYIIHRNEDVFPNPEEFIPERFLDEKNKDKFLFSYIPFSAGPRNCIGKVDMFNMSNNLSFSYLKYGYLLSINKLCYLLLIPRIQYTRGIHTNVFIVFIYNW